MKKIAVVGHFGVGFECLDGQTVKTKVLTKALCEHYGEDEILKVDTHGSWKVLFKAPFLTLQALKHSKNIIILPAHNGLRVNAPLLAFERLFFKNRQLRYVVIGGWLPEFLENRKVLRKMLKTFDGIYVETQTMKKMLEKQGFSNVFVMPNCKELTPLKPDELVYPTGEPYKLCTFSRVMKEKGIEDAVNAVKYVNEKAGRTVYSLDIYGQVDSAQTEWLENLQRGFPEYVCYQGSVPYDQSVFVLKEYFALLFPTKFYTEGIPGTIIDAYTAGVPVISARWESFEDVIDEGKTGYDYEFGNSDALRQLLEVFAEQPDQITELKVNCLKKAEEYTPQRAVPILLRQMKG